MPTRSDVDHLANLNRQISRLIIEDLNAFWESLDKSLPEATRDRLSEFLPTLVGKYGDIAATVSADWYRDMRGQAGVVGRYVPTLAANSPPVKIQTVVRRTADNLFDGTPDAMLHSLEGAVTKFALQSGRDTIDLNSRLDPWKPRVARVPTGPTTCDFCLMLASRGPVFSSREAAGSTTQFHEHDDCQIVVIGRKQPLPEGYDPAALLDEWREKQSASI